MKKKKRGFVLMSTSLIILVLLFAISAVLMNYVYQALRTEAFFTHRTQRTLYPIAWSTAYFVLDTLSRDITNPTTRAVNGIDNMFASGDKLHSPDILLSSIIPASGDMPQTPVYLKIKITGGPVMSMPIWVTVTASFAAVISSDDMRSTVVGSIVSVDTNPTKGIAIQWR